MNQMPVASNISMPTLAARSADVKANKYHAQTHNAFYQDATAKTYCTAMISDARRCSPNAHARALRRAHLSASALLLASFVANGAVVR